MSMDPAAASLLSGRPQPATASELLSQTFKAASLSSGLSRGAGGGGLGSLKGGVDVRSAPYAEVLDTLGGWSKRNAVGRVLFADAARQASSALQVASLAQRARSPAKLLSRSSARAASAGHASKRLLHSASAFAGATSPKLALTLKAAGDRSALASPLRQGYSQPCGLQSFNWTGFLKSGAPAGLRDPLMEAPLPEGAERDPTLRAILRLQRARVLAAAHANVRAGEAAASATAAATATATASSSSSTSSASAPAAAVQYTAYETDSRQVHKALFRSASGAPGFDGGRKGTDAAALASASAAAGELGYSWRAGSASAFAATSTSTTSQLPPRPLRLPSQAELAASKSAWAHRHTAHMADVTLRGSARAQEAVAAARRAAARAALAGDTAPSRAAFVARARGAARLVLALAAVGAAALCIERAGARGAALAQQRHAARFLVLWWRHTRQHRARTQQWRAQALLIRFVRRAVGALRARKRAAAGALVAAFLQAASAVPPALRVMLQFRAYAAATAAISRALRSAREMAAARVAVAGRLWGRVEGEVRCAVARSALALLQAAESGGSSGTAGSAGTAAALAALPPSAAAELQALGLTSRAALADVVCDGLARSEAARRRLLPASAQAQAPIDRQWRAHAKALAVSWGASADKLRGLAGSRAGSPQPTLRASAAVLDGAAGLAKALSVSLGVSGGGSAAEGGGGGGGGRRQQQQQHLLLPAAAASASAQQQSEQEGAAWRETLLLLERAPPFPTPLPFPSLVPLVARFCVPPTAAGAREAALWGLDRRNKRERKALLGAWNDRVAALFPFMASHGAKARQMARWHSRSRAAEEGGGGGGGGGGEGLAASSAVWPPPKPSLSRLPSREDLLPVVVEALRAQWGVAASER